MNEKERLISIEESSDYNENIITDSLFLIDIKKITEMRKKGINLKKLLEIKKELKKLESYGNEVREIYSQAKTAEASPDLTGDFFI